MFHKAWLLLLLLFEKGRPISKVPNQDGGAFGRPMIGMTKYAFVLFF